MLSDVQPVTEQPQVLQPDLHPPQEDHHHDDHNGHDHFHGHGHSHGHGGHRRRRVVLIKEVTPMQ